MNYANLGLLQIYKRLALNKYTSFAARNLCEKTIRFSTAPPSRQHKSVDLFHLMRLIHQQLIKQARVWWPSKHLSELSVAEPEVMTTGQGGYLCLSLHI